MASPTLAASRDARLRLAAEFVAVAMALTGTTACQGDISDRDAIFSRGASPRYCATTLDDATSASDASLRAAIARAAADGTIVHLYAHKPGVTVTQARLDFIYDTAREFAVPFYTYPQLATATGPGIALSFDDAAIDLWHAQRPYFDAHEVRATFFITRYAQFSAAGKAKLAELFAEGHAVEAHAVNHRNAYDYVARWGLAAYLTDEAVPSITALRDDGYPVTVFAYPFGARTAELDEALLAHVEAVRSIVYAFEPSSDPCQ